MLANYGVDDLRFLPPLNYGDTMAGPANLQTEDAARRPATAKCAGIPDDVVASDVLTMDRRALGVSAIGSPYIMRAIFAAPDKKDAHEHHHLYQDR